MGCSKSKKSEQESDPRLKVGGKKGGKAKDEFKVVLVGNAAVGKTSIVDKYVRGNFEDSY